MRSIACAVLLSGCLIVRVEEEIVDEPCPKAQPLYLADASGPFVLADDAIYFIGANGTLSRVSPDGGAVAELTTNFVRATSMAADATDLYWASDGTIIRRPFNGAAYTIATGYPDISHVVVDDTSVVWASSIGIDRWLKADQTITHLDDANRIFGLGASEGLYYFSDSVENVVRKTPPTLSIAEARAPGPLVVDDKGVYFYDVDDPFADYGGAIRLVPREGGTVVTTTDRIALALDLASDATDLYFPTVYGNEYRIKVVSRFGGTARTLACGFFAQQRIHVAVRADFLYWADDRGLYRIDKYGPF